MHQPQHEEITRLLVDRFLRAEGTSEEKAGEIAARAAKAASFPDRAHDLVAERVGSMIFGRPLCSLTHFQREGNRGYRWNEDPSIPYLDLPDRDIGTWLHGWNELAFRGRSPTIKDHEWMDRHPMRVLTLDTRISHAADEISYASASTMAGWLGECPVLTPELLGAILHFVQDSCVEDHARGRLLGGHLQNEGAMQELWFSRPWEAETAMKWALERTKKSAEPRSACIRAAVGARKGPSFADQNRNAVMWSARIMRWWSLLSPKRRGCKVGEPRREAC